jgi:Fuc2NAc and GlcNAc transferase
VLLFASCVFLFLASCLATALFRHYAIAAKLLDIPNDRSSHHIPTPRGGGVAFVLCFLSFLCFAFIQGWVARDLFGAILTSGFLIALIGFVDDKYHVPAKWRLVGHLLVCGLALYWIGGFPSITVLNWPIPAGIILSVLGILYLAWLLNLYNFMDGIDGIAAIEAVSVCFGGALLYGLQGEFQAMALPFGLAAAVGGFLYWNFPPARIFMGDAGSGFLGLVLGLLSLQAAIINPNLFWSWLILLGVFIVDATVTLIRRAIQGETLSDAHCNHAYQHASRFYSKHRPVTIGVFVINMLWLLPMSCLVASQLLDGFVGLLLAYLPLLVVALKFQAGKRCFVAS